MVKKVGLDDSDSEATRGSKASPGALRAAAGAQKQFTVTKFDSSMKLGEAGSSLRQQSGSVFAKVSEDQKQERMQRASYQTALEVDKARNESLCRPPAVAIPRDTISWALRETPYENVPFFRLTPDEKNPFKPLAGSTIFVPKGDDLLFCESVLPRASLGIGYEMRAAAVVGSGAIQGDECFELSKAHVREMATYMPGCLSRHHPYSTIPVNQCYPESGCMEVGNLSQIPPKTMETLKAGDFAVCAFPGSYDLPNYAIAAGSKDEKYCKEIQPSIQRSLVGDSNPPKTMEIFHQMLQPKEEFKQFYSEDQAYIISPKA